MEQLLVFLKLAEGYQSQAVEVASDLLDRKTPRIKPFPIPIDDVLNALKSKFKKLTIDVGRQCAEVDIPKWETMVSFYWTSNHFRAVFEGDGERAMTVSAAVFAKFDCGCVCGNEYFPPSAPYGDTVEYYPDLDALTKLTLQARKKFEKLFPDDLEKRKIEYERYLSRPDFDKEVDRLAEELEAKYRKKKPAEVVARTVFVRTPRDTDNASHNPE